MLAGPSHIYLMVQMIKSKLLLKQACALGLLSFFCKFLFYFFFSFSPCFSVARIEFWSCLYWIITLNFHLCCLLSHPSPSVLIPALRTVGNIVTGDDVQTQVFNNLMLFAVFSITVFCNNVCHV